jgi:Smg protein
MFDVLVYLFENYIHAEACPEPDQLARRLSAAGFEDDEISEALEWLSGLNHVAGTQTPVEAPSNDSVRIYIAEEMAKLGREGHGFIAFLESAGVLDARARELIIDRITALPDQPVSLGRIKVIVLMVLWKEARPMDSLLVDELLTEDDEDEAPTLQ